MGLSHEANIAAARQVSGKAAIPEDRFRPDRTTSSRSVVKQASIFGEGLRGEIASIAARPMKSSLSGSFAAQPRPA